MLLRWGTLLVWALVAGSAVFWGFQLFSKGPEVPPQTQMAEPGGGLRGDLTRLLGADAVAPAPAEDTPLPVADARFALIGVVSPRSPGAAREGVALIAVDGKPARAYRVGAVVEGAHVLKTVSARGVTLGLRDGPGLLMLDLPPLPAAATGTLPAAPSAGDPQGAAGAPLPAPPPPQAGRRPPPLGVTLPAARPFTESPRSPPAQTAQPPGGEGQNAPPPLD